MSKDFEMEMARERNLEYFEGDSEVCVLCGFPLKYESVSCDADGNRKEFWFVCSNSECEQKNG